MTTWIHPAWLRHDIRDVCCFIATASIIANCLPRLTWIDRMAARHIPKYKGPIHDCYVWLVDMVAFCAVNLRIDLPSMDFQFFGFARDAKHAVRNWRQDRIDRRNHTDRGNL